MVFGIPHTAVFALDLHHTLPIDGGLKIHIAGTVDSRMHLDIMSKTPLFDPTDQLLCGGMVRELAGALPTVKNSTNTALAQKKPL